MESSRVPGRLAALFAVVCVSSSLSVVTGLLDSSNGGIESHRRMAESITRQVVQNLENKGIGERGYSGGFQQQVREEVNEALRQHDQSGATVHQTRSLYSGPHSSSSVTEAVRKAVEGTGLLAQLTMSAVQLDESASPPPSLMPSLDEATSTRKVADVAFQHAVYGYNKDGHLGMVCYIPN